MSDSTPLSSLTIRRPDDWHIHLRDLAALEFTVPAVSRYFGRAIVMPNLAPPILDCSAAEAYRARIIKQRPAGSTFEPLMTLYLTDNSDPNEIRKGFNSGLIKACKLYPAGATTNSDSGVTDIRHIHSVIEVMQELGMPLLIHGEVTTSDIDIFDREKVFIDRHLLPLRAKFPELRIVLNTSPPRMQHSSSASKTAISRRRSLHTTYFTNATTCSSAEYGLTSFACQY